MTTGSIGRAALDTHQSGSSVTSSGSSASESSASPVGSGGDSAGNNSSWLSPSAALIGGGDCGVFLGCLRAFLFLEHRTHRIEIAPHLGRQLAIHPLHHGYLVRARRANPLEASEVAQQRAPAHRSDTLDIVEHRA